MAERADTRLWVNRGIFVLLAFAFVVIDLVPRDMRPAAWAGPDMLLAVTLAWVARKPSYLPVLVVAAFFLMTDLLFMRPPGLWAALVVVLTEVIRRQHHEFRTMPFLAEWGTIAVGIIAITLINRIVLALVMLPQAPIGLTLSQMVATILVYPLVLVAAHFIFAVRRTAPGEIDSRGQRL
ncbi:MAG: rod shape-determining protein MreD [Yoonia sp.]|uniref:rod shape-determining protein MreD n=1 Tax=Yoonia sp. TaxID=2212373 RepID=UPI003EF5BBBC